jgi:signal transduction histidine kinase
MINNSTDHFLEIMDSIMEISRIEAGSAVVSLSKVNPAVILARVHRAFKQRFAERGIELVCRQPENDKLTLISDSYKLLQILNNLVGNALKFTLAGKVEFGLINGLNYIEFYVADTGIGISDKNKGLIFSKFYQADSGATRRFQGIGLGLPIAKAYIEMLGGNISFVSEEGSGSTFRFTLPKTNNKISSSAVL